MRPPRGLGVPFPALSSLRMGWTGRLAIEAPLDPSPCLLPRLEPPLPTRSSSNVQSRSVHPTSQLVMKGLDGRMALASRHLDLCFPGFLHWGPLSPPFVSCIATFASQDATIAQATASLLSMSVAMTRSSKNPDVPVTHIVPPS